VKAEDLDVAREQNILNALQGKVTGVNIVRGGGNLTASSQVTIRGVTSLSGKNNPLWVVDGVPINDITDSRDNNNSVITGNRDFGNGGSVITPDDVASINVLKGAAATALYGNRGASGVIVVTTKKGKGSGSGPQVSINSSVRIDNLFRTPDFQDEFGGGFYGKYDSSVQTTSWGPRIVGQPVTEAITGNTGPLTAYPDNYKDYYRTGQTLINNFAIGDANERGDYRLSLTSTNQTGILPNAELDRINVSLGAGINHSEKLRSRFSVQFARTTSQGTGVAGANDPNIFGWSSFVRSTNFKEFLPWIDESGNQINTIQTQDNNPFWLQHENKNEREDKRFIGNFELAF
ncbi:MAG: TonB-dependent receptor plug domain-containing protein, partial [Cyclobacteriaceae bacterium]